MNSLAEGLLKAGAVNKLQYDVVKLEKSYPDQDFSKLLKKKGKASIDALSDCKYPREFKRYAKEILMESSEAITEVINLAHKLDETPAKKKLIWQLYSIRDRLKILPKEQHNSFLKKAFRKAGSKIE